jgi:hypothetical protein
MELFADEAGMTQALLKSADGARGALVSINVRELPFMTLWKNAASPQAGYVTRLEPSTSFPLPKPIERVAGRIPKLKGRESYRTKVTFTGLVSGEEVESAEGSIGELQRADPEIQISPFKATSRVAFLKSRSQIDAGCRDRRAPLLRFRFLFRCPAIRHRRKPGRSTYFCSSAQGT